MLLCILGGWVAQRVDKAVHLAGYFRVARLVMHPIRPQLCPPSQGCLVDQLVADVSLQHGIEEHIGVLFIQCHTDKMHIPKSLHSRLHIQLVQFRLLTQHSVVSLYQQGDSEHWQIVALQHACAPQLALQLCHQFGVAEQERDSALLVCLGEVADVLVVVDLSGGVGTIEKTEEYMRVTVERLWS